MVLGIIDVDRYLDTQKKTKTEEQQLTMKIFFNLLVELTLITCNFHIWFNTFSIFEVIIVTGFRESMRQFIKKVVFIPRWWNIVTISVVWSYHNKDNSNFLQPITCKDEKVHYVTDCLTDEMNGQMPALRIESFMRVWCSWLN